MFTVLISGSLWGMNTKKIIPAAVPPLHSTCILSLYDEDLRGVLSNPYYLERTCKSFVEKLNQQANQAVAVAPQNWVPFKASKEKFLKAISGFLNVIDQNVMDATDKEAIKRKFCGQVYLNMRAYAANATIDAIDASLVAVLDKWPAGLSLLENDNFDQNAEFCKIRERINGEYNNQPPKELSVELLNPLMLRQPAEAYLLLIRTKLSGRSSEGKIAFASSVLSRFDTFQLQDLGDNILRAMVAFNDYNDDRSIKRIWRDIKDEKFLSQATVFLEKICTYADNIDFLDGDSGRSLLHNCVASWYEAEDSVPGPVQEEWNIRTADRILSVILGKMKEKYSPQQMLAIVNHKDQFGKTALAYTVKLAANPLKLFSLAQQFVAADAFDPDSLETLYYLRKNDPVWDPLYKQVQENFVKAGQDEYLEGLKRFFSVEMD